ncbi:hypothetical protein CEXT_487281 [Caerostris extrusa]|uniref:Uncharacterized protein n=1 Tax=Caerostris extrusa TaxID=172846 RepID=A0AAV4TAC6_CAEEX|nr:hypothetical protein CEXT_487281 [Caerostris extrusa]
MKFFSYLFTALVALFVILAQSGKTCVTKSVTLSHGRVPNWKTYYPVKLETISSEKPRETNVFISDPNILQNYNNHELRNRIVEEACAMWPDLKIELVRPRHSPTQGSVEIAN